MILLITFGSQKMRMSLKRISTLFLSFFPSISKTSWSSINFLELSINP